MGYAVVLLHRFPSLLKETCDLVNSEWKRSETARIRSLESSSDTLPTSLVLLDDKQCVIGHCKLSPVPSNHQVCFVESVVINKSLRGQGHGSYLMLKAEEYCRTALGLYRIYLSTKGQEEFYAKLGYIECGPISIYGSTMIRTASPVKFQQTDNGNDKLDNEVVIIPIPPPMPVISNINVVKRTFMYKDLIED